MKRWILALVLFVLMGNLVLGADRKTPEKIASDELTKETQRTASGPSPNGHNGMYFMWYIPVEFWQTSLLQNPKVSKKEADNMIEQMKGVFIIALVRTEIGDGGVFNFYDEATVRKNLKVEYTGKDGKTITLKEQVQLSPGNEEILSTMKPVLQAAMGKMGQNMYFYVFNDGGDGKRLVPPDMPGKLTTTLVKLPGETGGKVEMQFPLNALFEPRECPQCHHTGMDIVWEYCPYCGKKLPE